MSAGTAPPPPPPPPHGTKSTFPPSNDKYQIFVVPPQSQGGGFIYFPSLRPQKNSFIAGALAMFTLMKVWEIVAPVLWGWTASVLNSGGAGVVALLVAVGLGSWVIGRGGFDTSAGMPSFGGKDGSSPGGSAPHEHHGTHSGHEGMDGNAHAHSNGYAHANGNGAPKPEPSPRPNSWGSSKPSSTFNNARSSPASSSSTPPQPGAWERAREETKKREEERKKSQAEAAARASAEKTRMEAREKEAREKREREAKERIERDAREALARERERERARNANPAGTRYASTSAGGDTNKFNPWAKDNDGTGTGPAPAAPPPAQPAAPGARADGSRSPSPTKQAPNSQRRHQAYAKSFVSDDGAESTGQYSFRPYDRPKANSNLKKETGAGSGARTATAASSVFSEEYGNTGAAGGGAGGASTAPTSPMGSMSGRGFATADPDRIVVRAVYLFSNAYPKLPVAELVGGQGNVSEGLVLSIGTEGLFIDDAVREVGQREWDIRAWTLKAVEVRSRFPLSSQPITGKHSLTDFSPKCVERRGPHRQARRPARRHPRPGREAVRVRAGRARGVEAGAGPAEAEEGQPGAEYGGGDAEGS